VGVQMLSLTVNWPSCLGELAEGAKRERWMGSRGRERNHVPGVLRCRRVRLGLLETPTFFITEATLHANSGAELIGADLVGHPRCARTEIQIPISPGRKILELRALDFCSSFSSMLRAPGSHRTARA
jgi:hypothetical protein